MRDHHIGTLHVALHLSKRHELRVGAVDGLVRRVTRLDIDGLNERPVRLEIVNRLDQAVELLLRKERPDLIISSGAAVAVPFFLIGKMFGSKCVYVEVFDRVDKPTMTGRMLNGVADLFVVQWPEQLDVYKNAVDLGSIF